MRQYTKQSTCLQFSQSQYLGRVQVLLVKPAQALERLQHQFKAYIRAEDPFNHKMCSHEGPFQWWNVLSRDEYSDVLSVSSLRHWMSRPSQQFIMITY